MLVLGIETSCDETAAAVCRDGRVASSVVASQVALHARYGGVVPELASRAHEEKMAEVLDEALSRAGADYRDLGGVAVTAKPGLIGALLVGLSAAKAVALALRIPLVGINHLHAHVHSVRMSVADLTEPMVCLLASGGHTCLYRSDGPGEERLLGSTTDDAAGEAFDKVAKLLGLGYPGGPAVEEAAARGDADAVPFPVARLKGRPLDFSFSGLKTAVLYHLRDRGFGPGVAPPEAERADIAASFQKALVRALVEKTMRAARDEGLGTVAVAGGVALNRQLRKELERACGKSSLRAVWPSDELCGDNAAMVAGLGALLLARGEDHGLALEAEARVIRRGK
jgi:N6-L-threonylcarbamoyladenine synthase